LARKARKQTKYEYIGELLRNLGLGLIDLERFWHGMEAQRFTHDDIDKWCAEYHRRIDNGREEDRAARATTAHDACS
jgi:hypothetical protein